MLTSTSADITAGLSTDTSNVALVSSASADTSEAFPLCPHSRGPQRSPGVSNLDVFLCDGFP